MNQQNKYDIVEPILFTSISIQNIGFSKVSEVLPTLKLIAHIHKLKLSKQLDYIIAQRILIESVKYN